MANLEEQDKQRVKQIISSFLDLEDQKKDISQQEGDLKDELAQILETQKGKASKLLSYIKKKYEKGEDELEEMYELMEVVDS